MKKDYSFLNKVVVFDNQGETIDRYTIVFKGGGYASSNARPKSQWGFYQHGYGLSWEQLDAGENGDFIHLVDEEEIKAYNEANKHLGKYKTINAMKRLPKQVLDCIEKDVEVVD